MKESVTVEMLPNTLFPSMWAGCQGKPCLPPFSCSDGDMLSLPTVNKPLVLDNVRVLQLEGKLVQCTSQTADFKQETFSVSAYPQGIIITVVVVSKNGSNRILITL